MRRNLFQASNIVSSGIMDEGQGSQYAIQIAVHTLRDRCRNLQQRVALLEEENVNLRIQCSRQDNAKNSLNELDYLRAQVAELSEQKEHFQNRVKMVTNENQDLWAKLSKLTRVNKSLGSQLTKINDTLMQHSTSSPNTVYQTNLIRSKTYTKNELQTKVLQKNLEENDKISLELEDISLKLSDSFSKQKKELDMLCSEISEMTVSNEEVISENCGFLFDEELENDIFLEVETFGEDLKLLKEAVLQQQTVLVQNLKNMENIREKLQCKTCQMKKSKVEKSTSTMDLAMKSFENKCTETDSDDSRDCIPLKQALHTGYPQNCEKICPLCSKIFQKEIDFVIFQQHVEEHFITDADDYEML